MSNIPLISFNAVQATKPSVVSLCPLPWPTISPWSATTSASWNARCAVRGVKAAPLEGGPLEGGMIFDFHPFPRGWQRKSTLKILQDHSSGKCGFLEIGPKNHGLQMASLSHGRHLQMNIWESSGDLIAGRGDDRQSHMWRGRLWR